MRKKSKLEVFRTGNSFSKETVELINFITCPPSYEVSILDMNNPEVADRARSLGIRSNPAVVIDGKLTNYSLDEVLMRQLESDKF